MIHIHWKSKKSKGPLPDRLGKINRQPSLHYNIAKHKNAVTLLAHVSYILRPMQAYTQLINKTLHTLVGFGRAVSAAAFIISATASMIIL